MSKRLLPLYLVPVLTGLDQLTKYLVKTHLPRVHILRITSFFQIVYVQNEGAAFGMFQSLGNGVFILISLCAVLFVLYLIVRQKESPYIMTLILSGALGNLIDRLRLGYVVDFIDLHIGRYHWPAFNLADTYLTVGLILLSITLIFKKGPSGT